MNAAKTTWRRVRGVPARVLILLVRLYQVTLSPIVGRHCRFQPTCSRYFIEAVKTHGAVRGGGLGLWRILRCNPLCKGGYDPVPPGKDTREKGLQRGK
ncbi:MAG: membrane protein insertion efficiency factor YidD [Phycisphaerae bacterium]